MTSSDLFLGLDLSTQAFKASLLESNLNVVSELEVRFDTHPQLQKYGTKGGILPFERDWHEGTVVAPVMLYVEAMDLLMEEMKNNAWELHRVRGISAAGQQHASVYWSKKSSSILSSLEASEPLSSQLQDAFSRKFVPNWQDSSTTKSCSLMETFIGGPKKLAEITGSKAHTRFTASQIHKWKQDDPKGYEETDRISLVSSFVTSLLTADGKVRGIDASDACGMNLLDMRKLSEENSASSVDATTSPSTASRLEPGWNFDLLKFCCGTYDEAGSDSSALELERKLGKISFDGGSPEGPIGGYFVKRYGFSSDCLIFPGTGDNPATFLSFSLGLKEAIVSLGTSDTVLVSTDQYKPDAEFHAFINPAAMGLGRKFGYFNMLVYKSGSLSREFIRDQYSNSDWDQFNRDVKENVLKDQEDSEQNIGFYWLKPEIIPSGASGIHRYSRPDPRSSWKKLEGDFPNQSQNAASILETQFLNYRTRSSAIVSSGEGETSVQAGPGGSNPQRSPGPDSDSGSGSGSGSSVGSKSLNKVFAVGGASRNPTVCQALSNVLNCQVCKPVVWDPNTLDYKVADYNSCSVAAAYKARWGWERESNEENRSRQFDHLISALKQQSEKSQRREIEKQLGNQQRKHSNGNVQKGVLTVSEPDQALAKVYEGILQDWKGLEDRARDGN